MSAQLAEHLACEVCSKPFQPRTTRQRFCGLACKARAQRLRHSTPRKTWAEINADWLEDVLWLIESGSSVAAICQSMHSTPTAIGRRLERNGHPELAPMFERYAR